jgi:predicted transposase/invertase (TIGR01784 family)
VDYLELRPAISISFLDHVLFPRAADYHLRFRLLAEGRLFPFSEDLEMHVLELPKFTKAVEELESDLDIWLYFLRHAEKMDMEALPESMRKQPLVLRALEELMMLTKTDQERERYESRRKAQLDYNTGLKVARMEGEEKGRMEGEEKGRNEGRIEGERIGIVHAYERLLDRPETPANQLTQSTPDELNRLIEDLQAALREHR